MPGKTSRQKNNIYYAIFSLALSACGGGGGGSTAGIAYTGTTSQASLTVSNGEEISTAAFQNGGSGQGLGTVLSSLTDVDPIPQKYRPTTSSLVTTLAGAFSKIQLPADVGTIRRAVQSESDSFSGECGGTASYTVSVDDVTGDFNGRFTFSNYCELDDVLNGGLSMSGNIDSNSVGFGNVTMTMTSLTIRTGNDSFTMDGSMSLNLDDNPIVATMDMKLKDNTTQQVFWVENVRLSIIQTFAYEELSMEGRFYHPDHGYVDITTLTPFRYTGTDAYAFPGVMVATGASGSETTLTSLSNTSYQIDIDEDGDGSLEQTITGNWSEL